MKNSLIAGTSNAVLRLSRLVLAAILASSTALGCGPPAAQGPYAPQPTKSLQPTKWIRPTQSPQAPQNSLVGQWRTVLQGIPLTLTIQANGQYMQVATPANGGTQSAQGGPYQLVAPNTIVFTVTDWSPKVKVMYIPDPGPVPSVPNPVGPYPGPQGPQWQTYAIPHPPGSRYAYSFDGPNAMILNNEQAQETITFTRVTAR